MAGGTPPFKLLERSGVSFDPALRPEAAGRADRRTGLVRACSVGLLLSLAALAWVTCHADFYGIPRSGHACIECHLVPDNFSTFSCTHRHEHDQVDMDEEHKDVNGYVWQSNACPSCHPHGKQ